MLDKERKGTLHGEDHDLGYGWKVSFPTTGAIDVLFKPREGECHEWTGREDRLFGNWPSRAEVGDWSNQVLWFANSAGEIVEEDYQKPTTAHIGG